MSSNNDSSAEKSTKRSYKIRKNAVEYQERVLTQVREMFDSILDPDVILSVVQNCDWKLQPSIEHLITLSANVSSPTENSSNFSSYSEDFGEDEKSASVDNPDSSPEDDAFEVDTDFTYLNINDEELQKQKDEFKKFELMKKGIQETNIINKSTLEIIEDEELKSGEDSMKELIEDKLPDESINQKPPDYSEIVPSDCYPLFPKDKKDSDLLTCNQNQLPTFNPQGSSQEAFKYFRQRKTETESLCGLKVQYRFGALETSSDDDADVVIEEETSDYNIPNPYNTQSNVCQFLSLQTQSPPKTTKPRIGMISSLSPSLSPSPSPSHSPFASPMNKHKVKASHKAALNRIKSTIQKGFKIMVLLRGVPGSGKSYLATDIVQSTVGGDSSQYIFCSDDFFMKRGRGVYAFDATKLPDAHAFNQQEVLKAVTDGRSPVIIDNTNTQFWEMQPYVRMAVQYGYFIEVLEPDTPWAYNAVELARRNKHNVSRESIQIKLQRFERNVTPEKLLRMFSLSYDPYNMPPQPCFPVPSPSKPKHVFPDTEKAKKRNKKNKKNLEAEKSVEDYPIKVSSARVVDAIPNPYNENLTALQLALKTFGGDDEDLSPEENTQNLIQDKWEDDGISWEDEMLSVKIKNKNSEALRNTLNEESSSMDNKINVLNEDKASLNLGAIGSERKNSMIKNRIAEESDDDNENILAECWDFTLLLDGRQIHSVGTLIENDKYNEEKGNEDTPEKSDDSKKSRSPSEEFKEAQNTLEKGSPDSATKSSTSFEHIDPNGEDLSLDTKDNLEMSADCLENSEELLGEENDHRNFSTDPQAKVSFGSIMKFIKKSFLGANNEESKVKKIEVAASKSSETVRDTLSEKLHSPIKDQNNTKLLDYGVDNLSDSNDTLSKKLSNSGRELSLSNLVFEAQNNFESVEYLGSEPINKNINSDNLDLYSSVREISSDNESFLSVLEARNILLPEKINLDGLNSEDRLISSLSEASEENFIKSEPIKFTGPLARAVLSLEENEKLILEEKELKKSETTNSEINLETSSKYFENIDNINSITWKESPFPTCEIEVPVKVEESKNVVTSESSTNTSIYDFNVSYVGGTNEPEYTLLKTVNRSINEGLVLRKVETPPPRKLKLDKSSMTNDVDVLLNLAKSSGEIEETDQEITQGLFDMFPHIPKDYVIDVFKNLCNGDSHWAIDVLLEGVPPGGILNLQPLKSSIAEDSSPNSSLSRNKILEKFKQSSSSDSNESEPSSPSKKKEKNQVSEDCLALKKYLEEKVMINEASYHPHILRVKKWKNKEPDVPTEEIIEAQTRSKDVIQFINDLSPTEVVNPESSTSFDQSSHKEKDESDGDDSSEPEDTMELNLGWDFIRNLEKEFGNPNLQFPDGLFPVIQVKKSVAEELRALWIESMQQQMDTQQEHLDAMIAKDAEYAKSLEAEEAKALSNSTVPNLSEVMDMELALAVYKNDLKKQQTRETPFDMASRLTRQMLNEMFPDSDPETLSEILNAHDGNFKETVQVLEASTGRSFSSTDTLNKQNSLMVKVKQQSLSKEERDTFRSSSSNVDLDTSRVDQMTYERALQTAHESREEAERQFLLRNENFNKAAEAYRRGNPSVASYYSQMAKLHSKKMESANSAAASAFLAAQTHASTEENTLDLHNLFVPEALQALDIFLDHQLGILNRGRKKSLELFIITGRGARSNNNKSKIKPAVSRRLTSRSISFSEANPGCLKVKLHRNNVASA